MLQVAKRVPISDIHSIFPNVFLNSEVLFYEVHEVKGMPETLCVSWVKCKNMSTLDLKISKR
jgi:hypothetical protein